MRSGLKILTQNEDGYALVVTMLLLVLLTVIGVAANHTSNVEVQIAGNERHIATNFYSAEGGLFSALENSNLWLTSAFLNAGPTNAGYIGPADFDGDGTDDATIEVRCIEITSTPIAALSTNANNVPADKHTGPPPINSGYSLRYFQIRKYGVTSTSLNDGTDVQSGVWKVFNRF